MDDFSRSLKFPGIYRALVLDNLDPDYLGRIKAQIYPMLADITDPEILPWCVPATPIFCGSGDETGTYGIPTINSFVFVFFENGDIYQPVYFAEAPNGMFGLPVLMMHNYPNARGFTTPGGFSVMYDDVGGDYVFLHPSGTSIAIDVDGNMVVSSAKDMSITVAGNTLLNCVGDVFINAGLGITITALVDVAINCINAKITASGAVDVKAGTTANVEAVGVTTIKGLTVQIN